MNSRRSSKASRRSPDERPPGQPFPGLRPFRPEEADRFCGREEQREAMLLKLEAGRFLAVIGASGSGKSSLVIAGLIADVADGNLFGVPEDCLPVICRPGLDPFRSLASALAETRLRGHENWISTDAAERMLRSGTGGLLKCHEHAAAFLQQAAAGQDPAGEAPPPEPPAMLIIVDQFEELFRFAGLHESELKTRLHEDEVERRTMPLDSPHDEAGEFVSQLLHTVAQSSPLLVVLTMRSDYLGDCEKFPGLPEAISNHQFLVPRLTRPQRATAIEQPLALFGATPEEGLVNRIINELGECDDLLPVLQHALARSWQMAVETNGGVPPEMLRHADYDRAGGVAEALQRHGESLLNLAVGEQPSLKTAGRIARFFRCLLDIDEGSRLIRRPVMLADAVAESGLTPAEVRCLASHFRAEGNNLLMPPPDKPLDDVSVLDVSHESLLRRWPLAQQWKNEELTWRQIMRRLQSCLEVGELPAPWLVQRSAALYSENPPTVAWAKRYECDWPAITASIVAAHAKRRRERIYFYTGIGVVALTLLSFGYSMLQRQKLEETTKQKNIAEEKTKEAEAARLAAEVLTNAAKKELDEARKRNTGSVGDLEAANARIQGYEEYLEQINKGLGRFLLPKPPVELQPAEPSAEETTAFPVPVILRGHVRPVTAVTFTSPTPSLFFTGALDGSLWPWEFNGTSAAEPFGFDVAAIARSPGNTLLATVAGDYSCRVIRLRPKPLTGDPFTIEQGGTRAAVAAKLGVAADQIQSVQAANPAGQYAPQEDSANFKAGEKVRVSRMVHEGQVAEFNPFGKEACASAAWLDDTRLVVGGVAGSLAVWDAGRRQPVPWAWNNGPVINRAHKGMVNSITVSADGKQVLTSSDDGTARLWTSVSDARVLTAGGPVRGASFSPDGRWILVPAGEATVRLWRWMEGELTSLALKHPAPVVTGKFSPDGKWIATLDTAGRVTLWDFAAAKAKEIPDLKPVALPGGDPSAGAATGAHGERGPGGALNGALAWGTKPEGGDQLLACGDAAGRVRVWTIHAGSPQLQIRWMAHTGAVNAIAVSADGKLIGTGSEDRTATLLPVSMNITGSWKAYKFPEMSPGEEIALYSPKDADAMPDLFGPASNGKTGPAPRLRDDVPWVAAAWNYNLLSRAQLRQTMVRIRKAGSNDPPILARPVDYASGGFAAKISDAVVTRLNLQQGDKVTLELTEAWLTNPSKSAR